MWLCIRPWRTTVICLWAIASVVYLSLWSLKHRHPELYAPNVGEEDDSTNDVKIGPRPKPQDGDQNAYANPEQTHAPISPTTGGQTNKSLMCQLYPDTGNIAVGVKTGATEAAERLAPLLNTTLSCVREVMVFSDLEQELYDIKLHDVLSRLGDSYKKQNPDFELYWQQKALKEKGQENKISELSQMRAPEREGFGHGKTAPWALDKYKFVPEVEVAYELQPGKDWYVFLEGDSYLSWPNLKRWLGTLDPTQKLYIGNAIQKSDNKEPRYFAHGGDGFILSGPAAKEFAVDHYSVTSKLEARMQDWWAGDFMLADALYDEMGLKVSNASPMFNMFDSEAIPFGLDAMWCQPAITLHHMDETKIRQIFAKETELKYERLLLRDVFDTAYTTELPWRRENWDNIASDKKWMLEVTTSGTVIPNKDFDSCKKACEEEDNCLQFNFLNTTQPKSQTERTSDTGFEQRNSCFLSKVFRLGHAKETQSFENAHEPGIFRSWTSGWRVDKIGEWVEKHQECPAGDHWVEIDPGKV